MIAVEFPPDTGLYLTPHKYIGKSFSTINKMIAAELRYNDSLVRVDNLTDSVIRDSNWHRSQLICMSHPLHWRFISAAVPDLKEFLAMPIVGKQAKLSQDIWDKCLLVATEEYEKWADKEAVELEIGQHKEFPKYIVRKLLSISNTILVVASPRVYRLADSYYSKSGDAPDYHTKFFVIVGNTPTNITGYIHVLLEKFLTDRYKSVTSEIDSGASLTKKHKEDLWAAQIFLQSYRSALYWDNSMSCQSRISDYLMRILEQVVVQDLKLAPMNVLMRWM